MKDLASVFVLYHDDWFILFQQKPEQRMQSDLCKAINEAYWRIRANRMYFTDLSGIENIPSDVIEEVRKDYGLFWSVWRNKLKALSGCRCCGRCWCSEEVEDLTGLCLERLQEHLHSGCKPWGKPSVCLFRLAHNVYCDRLRQINALKRGGRNHHNIPLEGIDWNTSGEFARLENGKIELNEVLSILSMWENTGRFDPDEIELFRRCVIEGNAANSVSIAGANEVRISRLKKRITLALREYYCIR